jgi:ERCC4-type nuclease
MNPFDVKRALENLTLLVDTREQKTSALIKRLKLIGLPYERKKLDFGDYSAKTIVNGSEFSFDTLFAIERKMSLDEL